MFSIIYILFEIYVIDNEKNVVDVICSVLILIVRYIIVRFFSSIGRGFVYVVFWDYLKMKLKLGNLIVKLK